MIKGYLPKYTITDQRVLFECLLLQFFQGWLWSLLIRSFTVKYALQLFHLCYAFLLTPNQSS